MDKQNIGRINALAAIAKQRALTPEEEAERAECRKKYLEAFRAHFKAQLDNTDIKYDDGTTVPLKDWNKK